MMQLRLLRVKLLLVLLIVVGLSPLSYASSESRPDLPEGVQKLSELIPGMGEHWADPKTMPIGPIYLVHEGKVVGMEYMFTPELMEEVSVDTPDGKLTFSQLSDLHVGKNVNHINVEFLPKGHAGFEDPHFDVHLYFVTPEERHKLVPHKH